MITPERAAEVVVEVLRNKGVEGVTVTPETALAHLALDSLDVAEALLILEEEVGDELDESGGLVVVGDLARLARREGAG